MDASIPDLLRLLAVPVLGWAAWRDIRTRRVPNRTWLPLVGLAVLLLLWEAYASLSSGSSTFLLKVAISLGFIVPTVTAFWWMGSFGGADAKAFYVIALLFPAYPDYTLGTIDLPVLDPYWVALPINYMDAGVFALTILSNTVIVGMAYPVSMALANLVRGNVGLPMVIGRPVSWDRTTEEYGLLLETPDGFTRGGLDLDALRMYLRWRGASLADLRAEPERYRDPDSLPDEWNPPGDGMIATDGGTDAPEAPGGDPPASGDEDDDEHAQLDEGPAEDARSPEQEASDEEVPDEEAPDDEVPEQESPAQETSDHDDPWGAAAFLDSIEHGAYGTTPEDLREGLEVLVSQDEVWISPGIPFLVPTFFGLLLALLYGDVLLMALSAAGLA